MRRITLSRAASARAEGVAKAPIRRRRSSLMLVNDNESRRHKERRDPSDEFLRAIVNVCASNVAVLDESGTILYASKAWRIFEETLTGTSDAPYSTAFFERCKRFTDPSQED